MPPKNTYVTSYVAHHWAASKGGLDLFHRAARGQSNAAVRTELEALARDVAEDRRRLRAIADAVGVGQARLAQVALGLGETVSRLKPNGHVLSRSPLSDVLEIEALLSAVRGKRAGWEGMSVLAVEDPRLAAAELSDLMARADDQVQRLTRLHDTAVAQMGDASA